MVKRHRAPGGSKGSTGNFAAAQPTATVNSAINQSVATANSPINQLVATVNSPVIKSVLGFLTVNLLILIEPRKFAEKVYSYLAIYKLSRCFHDFQGQCRFYCSQQYMIGLYQTLRKREPLRPINHLKFKRILVR